MYCRFYTKKKCLQFSTGISLWFLLLTMVVYINRIILRRVILTDNGIEYHVFNQPPSLPQSTCLSSLRKAITF